MTADSSSTLASLRLAIIGKLAAMTWAQAQQIVRQHGGTVVRQIDDSVHLVVVGEADLPLDESGRGLADSLDRQARRAFDEGRLEVISESALWQRLGLVEGEQHIHRQYTPAMLAKVLNVPVAVIRRWHRRGLIRPTQVIRRLAYFDFREVATARRLAELLSAGVSPQAIEKQLAALQRWLPHVERPLAQLSVIVEGKRLLLRQGEGLIEPGGQLHFDFSASEEHEGPAADNGDDVEMPVLSIGASTDSTQAGPSAETLLAAAVDLEDEGQLDAAIDTYRAAMAAGGPTPEACFQLAEVLYLRGQVQAAIERYYMAIELDENFVEARANLGCALAETRQLDLAVAALQGALAFHPDYPDVHYHLARLLDEQDLREEALAHWQAFLDLSPDSPWAVEARDRLGCI